MRSRAFRPGRARRLAARAGATSGLLLSCCHCPAGEGLGRSPSARGFPFIPAELKSSWFSWRLPTHDTAEPQESSGCQGKHKSSLHTHNFLKIVLSNLAIGHVPMSPFVFPYSALCFISLRSSHPAELLFQKCWAAHH